MIDDFAVPGTTAEFTVDQLRHLADLALDQEKWGLAKDWLHLVLARAPTSVYAIMDMAACYEELAMPTRALDYLERAAKLDKTGEADFCHAELLARLEYKPEAAAAMVRALDKSPNLVLDLDDAKPADYLTELATAPIVRAAMQRARTRFVGGSP